MTLFVWKSFFDANLGALNALLDATGLQSLLLLPDQAFGWGVFETGRGVNAGPKSGHRAGANSGLVAA